MKCIFQKKQDKHYYDWEETIGSIGLGVGNVVISFGIKLFLLYGAVYIYNLIPWRLSFSWWTFIPCYVLFDLCSYWAHNVSHRQRLWWATHVAHHSSEHYNLTVAFRLSWIQYLKVIFLFPVFLLGFHPIVFFVTNQVAILFQFWVHTQYIGKLPRIIEYIFVTPSNHRVHHSSQPQYINKNFGATFIFWDRIFGTYQEEQGVITYGITENIIKKSNPLYINFHELAAIVADVRKARTLRHRLHLIFGDPGVIAAEKRSAAAGSLLSPEVSTQHGIYVNEKPKCKCDE